MFHRTLLLHDIHSQSVVTQCESFPRDNAIHLKEKLGRVRLSAPCPKLIVWRLNLVGKSIHLEGDDLSDLISNSSLYTLSTFISEEERFLPCYYFTSVDFVLEDCSITD